MHWSTAGTMGISSGKRQVADCGKQIHVQCPLAVHVRGAAVCTPASTGREQVHRPWWRGDIPRCALCWPGRGHIGQARQRECTWCGHSIKAYCTTRYSGCTTANGRCTVAHHASGAAQNTAGRRSRHVPGLVQTFAARPPGGLLHRSQAREAGGAHHLARHQRLWRLRDQAGCMRNLCRQAQRGLDKKPRPLGRLGGGLMILSHYLHINPTISAVIRK